MFWHTGMAARIQRKSRGWKSSWTQRLTRQFFSWTICSAYEKCGFRVKNGVHIHFLEDRNCEIYRRTKIARAPCRRRIGGVVPRAQIFGDLITADHKVLSEGCDSRNNHRYAVVVQDLATQMDPVVSGQNKNFSGNTEGTCKSSGSLTGNSSHLH